MAIESGSKKPLRKPGRHYVLCGTPKEFCRGILKPECQQKIHASQEEAYNCLRKYLYSVGYTRLSRREWLSPETMGGGILVLDKKFMCASQGKYDGLVKGIITRVSAAPMAA